MYAEANFTGDKQCQSSTVKDIIVVQLWTQKKVKDISLSSCTTIIKILMKKEHFLQGYVLYGHADVLDFFYN